MLPDFCSATPGRADSIELEWNGTNYSATLTDSNGVLSEYLIIYVSAVDKFVLKEETK